jgi:hypothetical protein
MLLPEELYRHIPRNVKQWSPTDVQKWFQLHSITTDSRFDCTHPFTQFSNSNSTGLPFWLFGLSFCSSTAASAAGLSSRPSSSGSNRRGKHSTSTSRKSEWRIAR